MSKSSKPAATSVDGRPVEDMTTKSGKDVLILNSGTTPVVVNELGQSLGGGKFARVSTSDKVVSRLLSRKAIYVVSE